MKPLRRVLLPFVFLLAPFPGVLPLRAKGIPPAVAKTTVMAPVTVKESATTFTLANGIVTARIDKRTGELRALIYQGIDTLGRDQGHSGVWEEDPAGA